MSGKLYHIRIRPSAMLCVHLSAVIPAQVILAAVHKIFWLYTCTITIPYIPSMVDNSKPRDEGYVIDEPGGVVGVPTEDRTSSPPIVSAATQPSQHGIMSSHSPVPEATDTVTSQNEPRDPQVASLRSIFPDYDEAILCVFGGFSSTVGLIARFIQFCLRFVWNAGPMDILASFGFVCGPWTVNQS